MFFAYNAVLALAAILLAPYYLMKGKYRGTIAARFGCLDSSLEQTGNRTVWLHAVSVGEALSSQALVRRLRARLPGAKILVSATTSAGLQVAREKLAGAADGFFYAPIDVPFAVRRTLDKIRPRLVIILETEIWPNLFREVKRRGAALLIVNGRISDRSAAGYRWLRFFFRHVLRLPDAILTQSALDRQRYIDAGAPPDKVETAGNLKYDVPAGPPAAPAIAAWIAETRPGAVILAGSTRESEEAHVLRAFRELCGKFDRLLLVVAPRHPQRFDEVAAALASEGWNFVRRSELTGGAALSLPGVLLLDSVGELASLYGLADVVFVGGSLNGWGGHNVLEPAAAERPIVVGPYMQNFRAIADALAAAGGMLQIPDPGALAGAVAWLLEHPEEAREMAANARRTAELHRGATDRAAERAESLYHRAIPCAAPGLARRALAWIPARTWGAAVRLRDWAYRHGWMETRRLDTFVVSVGNLTAGGTGKSPLVIWLVEQLQRHGIRCAVLSRGYRRRAAERVTVLRPTDEAPVEVTGDEIQILRRRVRVPVGIAADRAAAGAELVERYQPEVILLDDGFQHRKLERDVDIVLLDVTDPFGGRELLPLGRLRERPEELRRADGLVLTRVGPGERWEGLCEELRRYNPRAPVFFARYEPLAVVHAASGAEEPVAWLAGRRVAAFCGIGNPGAFFDAAACAGARLAARLAYADHYRYGKPKKLESALRASGAPVWLTTEKDLVNLEASGWRPPELYWLRSRLVVEGGDRLLDLILSPDREGVLR